MELRDGFSKNFFIGTTILFFILALVFLFFNLNKNSSEISTQCNLFDGTYVMRVNSTAPIPYAYLVKNETFAGYFYPINFGAKLSDLDGKIFRIAN